MEKQTWADAPSQTAFPLAKAGYPYIFAAAFTTLVLALIGWKILALVGLAATAFICWFFRDPDRLTPVDEDSLVSPADGKIVHAAVVEENPYLPGPAMKVSIFMSVFNVHVNRAPAAGEVTGIAYHPGKYFNASLDKASVDNERNALTMKLEKDGSSICVVQVAGLVARRILCGVQPGDGLEKGRRFGMICFGSRVDLYLPPQTEVAVELGDRVWGGSSVLGYLK